MPLSSNECAIAVPCPHQEASGDVSEPQLKFVRLRRNPMNAGAKAVLGGVTAGLCAAALCAILFGVGFGDSAYDSPTIKVTFATCVFVSAFVSAKLALASSRRNRDGNTGSS